MLLHLCCSMALLIFRPFDFSPAVRLSPSLCLSHFVFAFSFLLLLDGLLGIGANGALRDPIGALAAEMNALRESGGAEIVAIDVPSGVNADDGRVEDGAVQADLTATIAVPKKGLVAESMGGSHGLVARAIVNFGPQ